MIGVLYRALVHHDVSIVEANKMELWEVAVLLGFEEDKRPRLVSRGEAKPAVVEDMPYADQVRIREAHEKVKRARESRGSSPEPI